ncbi:MAG: protein kinase [Myxococcota bacterium]|nr:protein kinase [Myxococcota bacterium]
MRMQLPCQFGNYELLERIAVGGMAEVYLARSFGVEGFEKRLVIKRILPSLARSRRFVEMFVREAKISALLSHPNVVQVFDLGRVGEDHYIAMELIQGRDLTQTVRKLRSDGRRLPLRLAVHAAASIARGLAYAHSRENTQGEPLGIVHRDVSPHNCMVSFQGEVKLLDFGIARLAGAAEPDSGGRPGGGKFAYMSPEQASGEPVDHRTDVFSCGIVLYELLVNHRLFQNPDPEEKLRLVKEAVVPDPREEVPEIPERLWEILQRALARDRDDRYASASGLEEDLRAFLFEAGLRGDEAVMGAFMRSLFAEEIKPDAAAEQMGGLVLEMGKKEEEVSEPPPLSDVPILTETGSETLGTPSVIAERKQVGVLVADLLGLTQVSVKMEPEDVIAQHRRIRRVIQRVVDKHGGWLDHLGDESLIVFFGVPRTQEDDLSRALSCAQNLYEARKALERRGVSLNFAVGVHRGEVVWIDEEGTQRCLPRGDTVKLARRLAASAEAGTVVVSQEVKRGCMTRWTFDEGIVLRGRGGRAEVPTFLLGGAQVQGQLGEPGRWLARGSELELLSASMDSLSQGRGGVISIGGGSGSGKSRFVRELKNLTASAGLPLYAGRAQPFGMERPLAALRDLVAQVLGLAAHDLADDVGARLERLTELGLTETDVAAIAILFDVRRVHGAGLSPMDLYSALLRFVHGLAGERPVVLVLEDAHHLGRTQSELVGNLMRHSGNDSILWLLTHRGEWPGELPEPDGRIRLGAMDRLQQSKMLCEVLGTESLGDELQELVVQTADGNPLYLVEMVRKLRESGLLVEEDGRVELADSDARVNLPPDLEGLITARVDAFAPALKQALQIAAAIGPKFPVAVLWETLGSMQRNQPTAELVEQGILAYAGPKEMGIMAFSSELFWEVVSRSTVGAQLRENHRRVAEGIERLYAGKLEGQFETLAQHCMHAGRFFDAARYSDKAGDAHREQSFLDQALNAYQFSIQALGQLQGDDEGLVSEGMAPLHAKSGLIAEEQGLYREAERHLQLALDLAEEQGISEVEEQSMMGLGRVFLEQGKLEVARAHLEPALASARASGDKERQVSILLSLGWLAREEANVESAEACYVEAAELAGRKGSGGARGLMGMAHLYGQLGEWGRALEKLEEARELAETSGDRLLVIRCLTNIGTTHFAARRFKRSIDWFRKAIELSQGVGYRSGLVLNQHNLADAYFRLGEHGRAYAGFEQSRKDADLLGMDRMVTLNDVYLGYLMAHRGEPEAGLERLGGAMKEAVRLRDFHTELIGQWLSGSLLCSQGDKDGGLKLLKAALQGAEDAKSGYLLSELNEEIGRWVGS